MYSYELNFVDNLIVAHFVKHDVGEALWRPVSNSLNGSVWNPVMINVRNCCK